MNIALVIYGSLDTLTGGYLYDRQMVNALRRRGHQVAVVGLPVRSYPGRMVLNWIPREARGLDWKSLDLLLQDELCHPSLIRLNRCRPGKRCPIVTVVHQVLCDEPRQAWRNRLLRLVEKRYLEGVDGFVFNSRTTRDTVWRLTAADRPHIVAPPAGDRLGGLSDPGAIAARAHAPGPLQVLFLGNLIPRKGLLPLIVALDGLPRAQWTLRVAGRLDMDQAYVRKVRHTLRARGLTDRIRLLGPREGPCLVQELSRAQVLCMPYAYEGFGMATLEAQAFGLPVIGSQAGATGELVTHGVNGYLVPQGDRAAVRQAVTNLQADRRQLEQMSAAARRRFEDHPTWEASMSRLAGFLEELVASRQRSRRRTCGPLQAVTS